jgi:DNA-directed RNA polymerase specialized sigma24 family protein
MDRDREQHLSHITTLWTLVRQAHAGPVDVASAARGALLERYSSAAHRYLLGALRDPDAADELFQEFALRFMRGDFRSADPGRGRFRDLVKTALFHLIVDHHKRRQARPRLLGPDVPEPVAPAGPSEAEQEFLTSWREGLMDRTWLALAELERQTGQPHHTVLRFRTDNPLLSSAERAEQLGVRLGKSFTVDAVRQALRRAREKFTDLLLEEVAGSLTDPSPENLDQELIDLGLWTHCQSALARRRS